MNANAQTTAAALASNADTTARALGFGSEALNTVATVAQQAEISANNTTAAVVSDFAQIAANAAPQTPAAAQEILNGQTPISAAGGISTPSVTTIAVVVGATLALAAYINTKGKAT